MSRAAPTVAVSPKMLRHFATATVAITFCVAIFADGEGREAIAEQIEARESRNNMLQAEADKLGARRASLSAFRNKSRRRSSFGSGGDGGRPYGAPMDSAGGGSDGSSVFVPARVYPAQGEVGPTEWVTIEGQPPVIGRNGPQYGYATRRNPTRRRPGEPEEQPAAEPEDMLAASRERSSQVD